jgi:opacity protein-like surface antigen
MTNPVIRLTIALLAIASATTATAQSSMKRAEGWEFGGNIVYLDGSDIDFEGGTNLAMDDDLGLSLVFGYRFNERFELGFSMDWKSVDYDATLRSSLVPNRSISVSGEMESFTPRVDGVFNFLEGPLTPYVTGGIGYAFIDTNIPNGQVQVGCWWDPWYGQICTPYQSTKSVDEFTYQLGLGARWDLSPGLTLKFGYEKVWVDLGNADSTPDFDQFKLGALFRY